MLLVKEVVDIESIWGRLNESFGCVNLLLQNKLCDVEKLGPIWKIRDNEKLIPALSNLVNVMSDLKVLAHKHKIENALYHSSNLGIIYNQIGKQRESKFISKNIDIRMDEQGKWNKIIEFLRREVRIKEEQVLSEKARTHISETTHKSSNIDTHSRKSYVSTNDSGQNPVICFICGKDDHVVSVRALMILAKTQ